MLKQIMVSPLRKLFLLLALLTACLGFLSPKNAQARPCCSSCVNDNPVCERICFQGC
jgi:hypothetical protein